MPGPGAELGDLMDLIEIRNVCLDKLRVCEGWTRGEQQGRQTEHARRQEMISYLLHGDSSRRGIRVIA